jgi:hypothetical protein
MPIRRPFMMPVSRPEEEPMPAAAPPTLPPTLSPAQRAGFMSNALRARQSATFAANAPTAGLSPDILAGRAALIDRNQSRADMLAGELGSPNYFMNRDMAGDANTRLNRESGAGVSALTSDTQRRNAMLPYEQGAMSAGTRGMNAQTDHFQRLSPVIEGQGRAELDRYQQMTPGMVRGQQMGVEGIGAERKWMQDQVGMANSLTDRALRVGQATAEPTMSMRDMALGYAAAKEQQDDGASRRLGEAMVKRTLRPIPAAEAQRLFQKHQGNREAAIAEAESMGYDPDLVQGETEKPKTQGN